MKITEKHFGAFENKPVTEYTLSNENGMQVSVTDYGATVTKIITPDKHGTFENVITGFDSIDEYIKNGHQYFGSTVGRYCNRIANASFILDDKIYTLAKNNGNNSLHGGDKGFDKVLWKAVAGDSSLKLSYLSIDGEEGYPGNLNVEVIFTLTTDNSLQIDYKASTDKPTPINLTNHCYFNLSAGKDHSILNHELKISADKFTVIDDELIPTSELRSVKDSMFNFTSSKKIGKDIDENGYDHNFVLNVQRDESAYLYDPTSGRCMDVFTTEPGLQFYSGNYLKEIPLPGSNVKEYIKHSALCLEAQHFPNSPNEPQFPSTILRPGEMYSQSTIYRFYTK